MDSIKRKELTGLVGKENCLFSRADLYTYAYDAGSHKALPQAVVFPGNTREVADLTRLANRWGLPLVPRGAGSGLTGGSVPARGGMVLSLQRMNRILEIDGDNLLAVVEPGVVNHELQEALLEYRLFYPPDPASAAFSTLGGNIAENAGGMRAVKYGVTIDYVMGLEVVLPTGEIIRTGSKCLKDVVGYGLSELFVGSEGTLGTITQAVLKVLPLPQAQGTLLAFFPDMISAAGLVAAVRRRGSLPAALEFMDQECLHALDVSQGSDLSEQGQTMLLIETDGTARQVEEDISAIAELCREHGAGKIRKAQNEQERENLWQLRRSLHAALHGLHQDWRDEDISVPVARIPAMLEKLQDIAQKHDLLMANFGHLGDGNIHTSFQGREAELSPGQYHRIKDHIYQAAALLEGRIAAEHGIGLAKRDYLSWNLDPATLKLMSQIKGLLDPRNILNPDKVFPPGQDMKPGP